MATPKEIRKIAEGVSSHTRLYDLLDPQQELFTSGVERILGRIDAVLIGKYRRSRLDRTSLNRYVQEGEYNSEPVNLVAEMREGMHEAIDERGIDRRVVIGGLNSALEHGVKMLEKGITDYTEYQRFSVRLRKKRHQSTQGQEGKSFTPTKVGPPSMYKTGLDRRILE